MAILGNLLKQTLTLSKSIERLNPVHEKPHRVQRRVLKKLLSKSQFTAFGLTYHFDKILAARHPVKEFQRTVPVHDYDSMYGKWWHKMVEKEEVNICWPTAIKYYALSSGTSGAPSKYIPVSREQLRKMRRAALGSLLSLRQYELPPVTFTKGVLTIGGSTDLTQERNYYKGDLSGITVGNVPLWIQRYKTIPNAISNEKDWTTKIEKIIEAAPTWDIGIVCGVPAWIQLIFEKIIDRYNLTTIHDMWPNLKVFIHGGVAFEPYRKAFERLVKEPLVYVDTYLASEGFIAYTARPNSEGMRLVLNNGMFYEFVPFNSSNFDDDGKMIESPETLYLNEVQEGVDYALLITSSSGAWRYLIGDTVKFTNVDKCEIIITGRTKHFLSMCGEHLSVDNMNSAVTKLSNTYNVSIPEYTVIGTNENDQFYHNWYIGSNDAMPAIETIKTLIDTTLCDVNDDYITERKHALKDIRIHVLPTAVFYDWMRSQGKEGGQHKVPRVLKGTQQKDWQAFVEPYIVK
jgi:GH3 auxin-responsive promoter